MSDSELNDKERQIMSVWRVQPVPREPDVSLRRVLRRANRGVLARDLLDLLTAWLWTLAIGFSAVVHTETAHPGNTHRPEAENSPP